MACCVTGYYKYKDIEAAAMREVLVCGRWRAVVGKIFVVKLYSCKIFSYVFCVRKYFCNKKQRIMVNRNFLTFLWNDRCICMPCTVGHGIQSKLVKHALLYCCPLEFATVSKAMLTTGSCSIRAWKPFVTHKKNLGDTFLWTIENSQNLQI